MSQVKPSKIERHRLKFHASGKKQDLLIEFDSLDRKDKQIIARDILHRLNVEESTDRYKKYIESLHDWGIACPHPEQLRKEKDRWFSCSGCDCIVMKQQNGPFSEGDQDGKLINFPSKA